MDEYTVLCDLWWALSVKSFLVGKKPSVYPDVIEDLSDIHCFPFSTLFMYTQVEDKPFRNWLIYENEPGPDIMLCTSLPMKIHTFTF